ncbi:magnesium-translocating P-type ATPase [Candidatus Peregrinibacteria bacterium]|nr:magnesium-translocating P-type ATPase [Candidatus Peregrinibacteria bacterium]
MRSFLKSGRQIPNKCAEYAQFAGVESTILLGKFGTSLKGLRSARAEELLEEYGPNELARKKRHSVVFQFLLKFGNPLVVVLLIIAAFSFVLGDHISGVLVTSMAVISVLLSFFQEFRAGKEAEKLSEMVRSTSTVYRDGKSREVTMSRIVPGDIVDLFAGDMIPADLRILSSKDLFINQASLTGESLPVEKFPAPVATEDCSIADLANIAFMGSSVVSGTALGLVIKTGLATQFGEISRRLATMHVDTSFDRGIRRLTWFMIRTMLVLIAIIFAINVLSKGNTIEALLFSLAVAVGLTPEMLPMVVAMNLSKGAIAMSKKNVIVKRLNSMQNFGAMDVLCTDKTGTLTLDKIVLERFCDVVGNQDETVLRYAFINSFFQTGLKGLLDRTILGHQKIVLEDIAKIDEIPFDFSRKFMSVVVLMNDKHRLIAKGAPEEIFKRCSHYKLHEEVYPIEKEKLSFLKEEYDKLSGEGFRVIAVAYRDIETTERSFSRDDERDLILRGYLAFLDPPKPTAKETIDALHKLGIEVKVLTGDNPLVTRKICSEVGLDVKGMMEGDQIEAMGDEDLRRAVRTTNVFARLSPLQKERIIHALHANQHVVGFLGDGINDAPALKAADVGISVNNAVDIAKESADLILLKKSLTVLQEGVIEGRKTFGNIIKYIRMGTSSNFGNMLSMTGASLLLPFIPMLPIQVLLNNFLYDLSQLAIPTDEVDEDSVRKPRKWDIKSIRRFMLVFGPISSFFDFLTFAVLLLAFHLGQVPFHTAWFLESLITQTLVIHVIRTDKIPFTQSRPSTLLLVSSVFLSIVGLAIPFSHLANAFHFAVLPAAAILALSGIVLTYLTTVQMAKTMFVKKYGYG